MSYVNIRGLRALGRKTEESATDFTGDEGQGTSRPWWGHLLWVVVMGVVGFTVAVVGAEALMIPRPWYVLFYAGAVIGVVFCYMRWSGADFRRIVANRWMWGLVAGGLIAVFAVKSVLIQEASPPPDGAELAANLTWLGVVYGTVDALLLSMLPVYATWQALRARGWSDRLRGRAAAGVMATLASMLVILMYHLGYPECRGSFVLVIMVGVAVQTVGYVVTRSPLSPVVSHIAMHLAAVMHGLNSVSQLPPHY